MNIQGCLEVPTGAFTKYRHFDNLEGTAAKYPIETLANKMMHRVNKGHDLNAFD